MEERDGGSGRILRPLEELLSDDPGWPIVQEWIAESERSVEVLPAAEAARRDALHATQVTTRSPMGAVIYETGGILLDRGWLRILGSGHPRLPRSLPDWNRQWFWTDAEQPPPLLIVADDVLGGTFAIDGGVLGSPGELHYFGPDSLQWSGLGAGYSQFLRWALVGDTASFYSGRRWPGWEEECAQVAGDQGIAVYPFLWADGPPIAERKRAVVPFAEVVGPQFDFVRQMGGS